MPLTSRDSRRRLPSALLTLLLTAGVAAAVPSAASAAATGTVAGVVTDSAGVPVEDTWVSMWPADYSEEDDDYYFEEDTSTDLDGSYQFTDVPAGSYYVLAYPASSSDIPTYHPSAGSHADAEVVTVTDGGNSTADVQLQRGTSIAGTVTKPGGSAAPDVEVTFYMRTGPCDECWDEIDFAESNSAGAYKVTQLPPGTYRVGFTGGAYQDEFYNGTHAIAEAEDVVVAGGDARTGVDVQLDNGATISGATYIDSGGGLTGIRVIAIRSDGWVYRSTTSGANGTYALRGLSTGTYDIYAYNTSGSLTSAHTVRTVTAPASRSNVNLVLDQRASIAGLVTDPGGAAVRDGYPWIYRKTADGPSVAWQSVGPEGEWRADGRYVVYVDPGTYRIGVEGYDDEGDQFGARTFFGNVARLGQATDIVAASQGQEVEGRDIMLLPSGRVTGKITVPAGYKPTQVGVDILDATTGEVVNDYAAISNSGTWAVDNLAPGSYKVAFNRGLTSSPLAGQVLDGVIELAAGQVRTGVNVTLTVGSTLSGTARRHDGSPAAGCYVRAFTPEDALPERFARTATDGTFTLRGLSAGDYRIAVNPTFLGEPAASWACVGLDDPGDGGYPGEAFYSAADGTLAWDDSTLRSATVPATGDTALPVELTFADVAPLLNATAPTITGTPQVGAVLTASPGTWAPAAVTPSYQWKAGDKNVGDGSETYEPTADDLGKRITVVVTASKPGHTRATATSAATPPVVPEVIQNSVAPSFYAGPVQYGKPVHAHPGAWSPGATLHFQWFRNGTAISSATRTTYYPVPGDIGARLSFGVTAVRDGAATVSRVTPSTKPVTPGQFRVSGALTVAGKAKVGGRLRADAPNTAPDAWEHFQWLRNGKPIPGARAAAYRVKKADKGKRIAVRVTLKRKYYTTVVRVRAVGKVS